MKLTKKFIADCLEDKIAHIANLRNTLIEIERTKDHQIFIVEGDTRFHVKDIFGEHILSDYSIVYRRDDGEILI